MIETYDHIVIGAGSAGCAVAARLSEDTARRILLIEAGGSDLRLETRAPAAFGAQFHKKGDWNYYTEPEPAANGRRIYQPRGKVIGGTSAMNAMLWVRGSDLDYDGWGIPGWSWAEVEPWFLRIERHFLDGPAHGQSGPMRVTNLRTPDPVARAFVDAAVNAGIDRSTDVSGPRLDGVALAPTTTYNGRRWSTARGYLDPARRRVNLTILPRTLVRRVVFDGTRAVAVEVEHRGRVRRLGSSRDIVLAAGAFNTPQLLQLSGIGPAEHLASLGITPLVDNPEVGAHLTEHPMTFCNYELTPPWQGLAGADRPRQIIKWLLRGQGKLASNVAEAIAHVRTDPSQPAADMQLVHAPAYYWDNGEAEHPRPALAIAQSYWTPRSRGYVRVTSADPREPPAILMNLLAEQADVDAIVRGIHLTRSIADTMPLREMISVELTPGPDVRSDAEIEHWVRETCLHTYHPSCTARMGPVLDPQLRVHDVQNLRVADASALPTITRANTNAPAILIGERCADFIRRPGIAHTTH